jgi:hypothetical protein
MDLGVAMGLRVLVFRILLSCYIVWTTTRAFLAMVLGLTTRSWPKLIKVGLTEKIQRKLNTPRVIKCVQKYYESFKIRGDILIWSI